MQKIVSVCNHIILYGFYALFFLVPLTFTSATYELFEFNKMWLTFALGIVIAVSWGVKMVLQSRIVIQKTPLDIPILLFVVSQIISTVLSLDPHVSMWGYYSRFNGGLLSILCYVLLYYAFVSNYKDLNVLTTKSANLDTDDQTFHTAYQHSALQPRPFRGLPTTIYWLMLLFRKFFHGNFIIQLLKVGLLSGAIVALWGLPGHFGYDPTCLLFRGTLDVSCWTEAFQPKLRIFSTFGQPNWLGAYLAILLPIAIGFLLVNSKSEARNPKQFLKFEFSNVLNLFRVSIFDIRIWLLILVILFYLDLIFTGSQSGFAAFWLGLMVLSYPFVKNKPTFKQILENPTTKTLAKLVIVFLAIAFFIGHPIRQLEGLTFPSLYQQLTKQSAHNSELSTQNYSPGELGGTASGEIRKIVWQGGLTIWKNNLLFGSGVETFAYAYYQHRPVEHNLTSEWDFLYNKAHNEYLNFLATTGIFGLGSYLFMIGTFLYISFKRLLNSKHEYRNTKQYQNDKNLENSNLLRDSDFGFRILPLGLLAAYTTILASNFLGFSVVVINIYFYLIPAFVLLLLGLVDLDKQYTYTLAPNLGTLKNATRNVSVFLLLLLGSYCLLLLARFWLADTYYAKGYNYDRSGEYQLAYSELLAAVNLRFGEPTFQDEYGYNTAVLAVALSSEDQATAGAQLAQESERISDYVVAKYPNNIVFWKTRVRTFYALSQMDNAYLPKALEAIKKAAELGPTDAKVSYNLGVLYGQNDQVDKAIETLEHTVKLKPDYADAWYALGLYYREAGTNEKGVVTDIAKQKKAIEVMEYVVKNFPGESSASASQALEVWKR